MSKHALVTIAIASLFLGGLPSLPARARQCPGQCQGEPACILRAVTCLLEQGQAHRAVAYLKGLDRQVRGRPFWAPLLARAYLADGNPFWAERVLLERLRRQPGDCRARAWLAWVRAGQGDIELARQALAGSACPQTGAEHTRWLLLEAYLKAAAGEPGVAELLGQAAGQKQIFSADYRLLSSLRRSSQPGWLEPVSLRIMSAAGYSSNARAGSPTDAAEQGPRSLLGRLDMFSRFVWPLSANLRPTLEASLKAHGIAAGAARDLSYLELGARPGIYLGGRTRLLLAYKIDQLLIGQKDRRNYYQGHRGELELDSGPLTLFAGAGRRIYAEGGRSRWELDGGLGGGFGVLGRLRLLLALSVRSHRARSEQYNLFGLSGLVLGRLELGGGFDTRLALVLSRDDYLDSGGERGLLAFGTSERRRDLLFKMRLEGWGPDWHGVRLGVGYEFTRRDSTADEPAADYDYLEHRLLVKLVWTADFDPFRPAPVEPADGVALDYGLQGGAASLDSERIQDLLRQDEATRRGSSCVE